MKRFFKSAALIAALSMTVMCFSGCSLISRFGDISVPALGDASKQGSIIGSWHVDKILDENGSEVSIEDIDIPIEPFSNMSGLTESVLSSIEFKFDNNGKVSFFFVSADYTYADGTLSISVPEFDEVSVPCEISGSKMTLTIEDYKLIFKKS